MSLPPNDFPIFPPVLLPDLFLSFQPHVFAVIPFSFHVQYIRLILFAAMIPYPGAHGCDDACRDC